MAIYPRGFVDAISTGVSKRMIFAIKPNLALQNVLEVTAENDEEKAILSEWVKRDFKIGASIDRFAKVESIAFVPVVEQKTYEPKT